jgi:hypothetical protein
LSFFLFDGAKVQKDFHQARLLHSFYSKRHCFLIKRLKKDVYHPKTLRKDAWMI